jgi:HEXXH motif-containing protein
MTLDEPIFSCSAERALALDRRVRHALADSIAHVHAAGLRPPGIDDFAVERALAEIRAHRVNPGIFGCYYDMVLAARSRRHGPAAALLGEIVARAAAHPALDVIPFSEPALGADTERYNRLLDLAAETPALLAAPAPAQAQTFKTNVAAALALIARADAAMAAELRGLIVRIIGAVPPAGASARAFEGASSFMLWGAVVLNVDRHPTPLDVAAGLVHEAAHQLLFGLSQDAPLVENPRGEKFPSPLRRDPRPMLGVFHAAFVCARLVQAYQRLRDAACAADRGAITGRLEDQKRRFWDGYEIVRRHASLTANGAAIMGEAFAFMQGDG